MLTIHACRVCGLIEEDVLPWGDDGETPSFDFCSCCGVEFGNGDQDDVAAENWRQEWLRAGATWAKPAAKPADWNVVEQLENVMPKTEALCLAVALLANRHD